jgi:hypothetical protein
MPEVFTFHDSTLECVVNEDEHWKPTIQEFAAHSDAREAFGRKPT